MPRATFHIRVLLLFLAFLALSRAQAWFGVRNQYKCHCTNSNACDKTRGCPETLCEAGWFGPACQYANLVDSLSTPSGPRWLSDNDDSTCNDDDSPEVTVTFNASFPFTWLRLVTKDTVTAESFTIKFRQRGQGTEQTMCSSQLSSQVSDSVIDIHCSLNKTVEDIRVTGNGVLSLCSIYVSGGRNVALKEKTEQTSRLASSSNSAKAVDGNTNGKYSDGSCTHTAENDQNPTWNVTFSNPVMINRYVLYNRDEGSESINQGLQPRLKQFELKSLSLDGGEIFTYNEPGETRTIYTVQPEDLAETEPISTVIVRATIRFQYIILTICEAEMYGDTVCNATSYGRECEHRCYCLDGESCFVSTGRCPSGCAPGYGGDTCSQPCIPGTYGPGCVYNCSGNCKGEQFCDSADGACAFGCIEGYTGSKCDTPCAPGTYGANCTYKCSGNCRAEPCDFRNGTCSAGCQDGYLGEQCDVVCSPGNYGQDCNLTCSPFCRPRASNNNTCDHVTGKCHSGCLDGYGGDLCRAVDVSSEDVPIGAIVAPIVIVIAIAIVVVVGIFMWRRRKGASMADNPYEVPLAENRSRHRHNTQDSLQFETLDGVQVNVESASQVNHEKQNPPGGQYENVAFAKSIISDNAVEVTTDGSSPAVPLKSVVPTKPKSPEPKKPKPPGRIKSLLMSVRSKSTGDQNVESGSPYSNISSTTSPRPIAVNELATFLASHDTTFFKDQFNTIPANKYATTKTALSSENRVKNRYKNICAYDHSRVHLMEGSRNKLGGYINASYIQGFNKEETFIASQGPTKTILEDFVRMLWEQSVDKVVMLTNLVEGGTMKCERYWPEEGEMEVGEIKVRLTTTQVFADYTIRRLQLSKTEAPVQEVVQFHFTSWPDKDVPQTPWGLVDFEQRVASYPTNKAIVVHCSAGVGRTGTFIALRNVMREAEDTGQVDFFTTVQRLRVDRMNMVQTAGQYEFLHYAAQVAILCVGTTVTANDIHKKLQTLEQLSETGQSVVAEEFRSICSVCADDDKGTTTETTGEEQNVYENSKAISNRSKNRLSNILPKEQHRVTLIRENDEMGDYINAVFIPSFTNLDQWILTQLPLSTTVEDFWRMVIQHKVSLIVAFEMDLPTQDATIGEYLPQEDSKQIKFSQFNIEAGPVLNTSQIEERKIVITADAGAKLLSSWPSLKDGHHATHLTCKMTGLDPEQLLAVALEIRSRKPGGNRRTVYACRNGADHSGLMSVVLLLLDRMDNDHRLTVPLVVGEIKTIRPQVIPTLEQYKLLYQILRQYSEMSNVYCNFGEETKSATTSSGDSESVAGLDQNTNDE